MCVQVRATDNGSPPRFTDHSLTVNIVDVNDNAPVVQSPRGYNVSVSEVGVNPPANQTTSEPQGPRKQSVTKTFLAETRQRLCIYVNMIYTADIYIYTYICICIYI